MHDVARRHADHTGIIQRLLHEVEDQRRRGWHKAAQLAIRHQGALVLNHACGTSDADDQQPLTTETPFLVCSIGKPLLALCIHHLAESGAIDLDCPIAEHWPEFSQSGKDRITFRHALLHQSGLAKQGFLRQLLNTDSLNARIGPILKARPSPTPGSVSAYHPLNYGYILGEALRRVSGMSPQAYLQRHFLDPMKLKATSWEPSQSRLQAVPKIHAAHISQLPAAWIFNRLQRQTIHNPGFNLYSNAHELSVIFQMLANGGSYQGRRYLRRETVKSALKLRFKGVDMTIGRQTLWAEGFHLGGRKPEHRYRPGPAMGVCSSERTFGHCGHMSSIVWADTEHNLVMAFTCNGLLDSKGAALRWQRLADLAWELVQR
jgi:CubicO group peptidase (beta-lactamase class C family)